jgi:transcriptional regulator with XRE-family HTH domain
MSRKRSPETTAIGKIVQRGLGERLRLARTRSGTKQQTLAADLHITRTSVSNIERGRHRVFLDQVYIAAHSLGVPVEDLLPPLSDVFPGEAVSFASDALVSSNSAKVVSEIVQHLRDQLAEKTSTHATIHRRR